MSNRSYKIWLVTEYSTLLGRKPVKAYTDGSAARKYVESKNNPPTTREYESIIGSYPVLYEAEQIDLIIHDGAHAFMDDILKSKKR